MKNINQNFPNGAKMILDKLNANGYEAYLVGGCVRDILLCREPHDWDICTSATPKQMQSCFTDTDTIETGIKHGTLTIKGSDNKYYETTTFRIDGKYTDNRRPDSVEFVTDINEDLSRRDFTANAIACGKQGNIIDPFNGQKDLKNKIIKCVGNPDKRFNEDALRIMRAIRFAVTNHFSIDENTSKSIHKNKDLLKNISAERLNSELCKILLGLDNDNIHFMQDYRDIFAIFIPEIEKTFDFNQYNPYHSYDVYGHILKSIISSPKDLTVRLSALFHDIGKPDCLTREVNGRGHFYGHQFLSSEMANTIMRRLKFDNETINTVVKLVENHDNKYEPGLKSAKKMLRNFGEENTYRYLDLQLADALAHNTAESKILERVEKIKLQKDFVQQVLKEKQCFSLKDLDINGNDLILIGMNPGKEIGHILNDLLNKVIDEPELNNKEILLKISQNIIKNKNNDIDL